MTTDIIDQLVGIAPGDALDALRNERPNARLNAQASYDSLLHSAELEDVSQLERLAVAYWTVALTRSASAQYYRGLLAAVDGATANTLDASLPGAVTTGPYGDYPDGPLSVENLAGPHWEADAALAAAVGPRLVAALAHTHLLVYRPRDASGEAIQALLDADWSTTGIVTLSQLVAFLSFQLRLVAGLTVLKGQL